MRSVFHTLYLYLLRTQGAVVLCHVLLLIWWTMDGSLPGIWQPFPLILCSLATLIALAFAAGPLTPRFLSDPSGLWRGTGALVTFTVTPFVFIVPVMSAMVSSGLHEDLARSIATAASTAIFMISAVLWVAAAGLALSAGRTARPRQTAF